jgi:hypothetical protein
MVSQLRNLQFLEHKSICVESSSRVCAVLSDPRAVVGPWTNFYSDEYEGTFTSHRPTAYIADDRHTAAPPQAPVAAPATAACL